jgi:hypothetical protein
MGLFGGGNSSTSSQTQNNTSTVTQDRRAVADGGSSVISADNSTINSYSNTSDYGAIAQAMALAGGALGWSSNVATNIADVGIGAQRDTAIKAIQSVSDVSKHVGDIGLSMLTANTALTNSLANGSNNLVTHALDVAGGLYRDAASKDAQVVGIAQDLAKTQVAAANDNRYLIAAGMAVVCIVAVMAFRKGH